MSVRAMLVAVALVAVPIAAGGQARRQDPTGPQLADLAASYAAAFVRSFAGIVAEERSEQTYTTANVIPRRRSMVSDTLLVLLPDGELQFFRDVLTVDGKPVRDRDDRLARLLLTPSPSAIEQGMALLRESARHNVADIGTINNPLLGIGLMQSRYASRFKARVIGPDRAAGEQVSVVELAETTRPTLLRWSDRDDLPATVRIWLNLVSGRVLKTQVDLVGTRMTTAFAHDNALDLDVPTTVTEFHSVRTGPGLALRGQLIVNATFGRFRRFQVTTEEKLQ